MKMLTPLMISSGGLTGPQRLLPFFRFSMLYPRIFVPPVLAGGDQARLMQSLNALSTFGADGGPGYAVRINVVKTNETNDLSSVSLSIQVLILLPSKVFFPLGHRGGKVRFKK